MSKFPNGCFPGFFQFCMEKKEFAVEMKRLYDFPYFLMHFDVFRLFVVFPFTIRETLLTFTRSKLTMKTLEEDMKHV